MTGWTDLLSAAAAPHAALTGALSDPARAQAALLLGILRANADSEFGRRHGFARLATWDAYREAVPVATYDAFRPFVERIAAGEQRILTRAPVIAFEETGGTASGGKLIPYTAAGLAGFRAAVLPWLADLARRRPRTTMGSAYVAISPATRRCRRTQGGLPVGLASDAAYLGEGLAAAFLSILAVPAAVARISGIDEWRIATLAHLVERDDLSFVSVWSPTFFLDLVESLKDVADAVARRVGPPARARMADAFRRPELDTARLWPRLALISCWADASSQAFARRLAALFPHAVIEPKGLFATEAAITLPWAGRDGAVPALTSTFIEFVDVRDRPRLAHDLSAGDSYRVVITTPSGLYRYDTGDQLRCVGHDGDAPRLVFEGRAALVSDLVGEKLHDAFVSGILARLPVPAALVPRSEPKPHYELWLDGAADPAAMSDAVDAGLRRNPQYAYARDIGQLGPIRPLPKTGFLLRRHRDLAIAGRRLGDLKHVSLDVAQPRRRRA